MKNIIAFFMLVFSLGFPFTTASAQATPSVIDTTISVDADVRAAVDAWLATSAPIPLPYWAITYVGEDAPGTFVSLVALNIENPTDTWHVTDDDIAWMGSIIIHADNSVELYSDGGYSQQTNNGAKVASPILAPGGGANIKFPWASGSKMMYGTRGVHAAGGGGSYATGFSAVDFLGGDDLGSGVASNRVYAAADGEVDYVCTDDTTTLVRITDDASDTSYIYAHLLDNSNLEEGHSFSQGQILGALKYGTFNDNCGWAEQTAKHYHLHFGFKPASGSFRMENCVLSISTQKWACGTTTISTGQYLQGGVGNSVILNGDDFGADTQEPTFWDYAISGFVSIYRQGIVDNMPSHTANQFIYALYNGVSIALRIARVMVYSNLNLQYFVAVLMFGMAIKFAFAVAEFIAFLFKMWKSLVPILGA